MAAFTKAFPLLSRLATPAPVLRSSLPRSRLAHLSPPSAARHFSSSPRAALQRTQRTESPFAKAREAFRRRPEAAQGQGSAKGQQVRGVATQVYGAEGGKAPVDWRKIGINVGVGAAGAVALNLFLNSPDGSIGTFEGKYLRETFAWTAGGLAITAGTAYLAFTNGVAVRLMALNPWLAMGGGLVLSVGSMMGVYYTAPDSPLHYASWAVFTAAQGLTLSPLFFVAPAVLGRAGLLTLGATGGISYIGATAESEKFLWIGGPLLAGLGVLICANLAPMLMPRMALRTLSTLETVSAYGGVAVFSGFILYDTQKIRKHAQLAQMGRIPADPVRESVSLVLDIINLFTSIVRVLLLQQSRRK